MSRPDAPGAPGLSWSGRLAVRVDGYGGSPARQASAGFELRGRASAGSLLLMSPIGTTIALAEWLPGSVLLRVPDQPERSFTSLDDLSRELLGEPLPITALFDWLDARPAPAVPHQPFGPMPDGSAGFEQAGWRIDVSRRAEFALQIVRTAAPQVTVRVRLNDPRS